MGYLFPNVNATGVLLFFVISILVLLFLFLIIRWFLLWYWRINEAVDALMNISNSQINISNSLKKISNSLERSDNNMVDNKDGQEKTLNFVADNKNEMGKTLKQMEAEILLEEKKQTNDE